jgi:hypothetical protein
MLRKKRRDGEGEVMNMKKDVKKMRDIIMPCL